MLEAKLAAFNPWLTTDAVRSIVETLDALPASIEGNRELLSWLRGERAWYDEAEKRQRAVTLIDFEHPAENVFHVTWEWKIKPPARKGNRADVMFVVNGVPVVIVEHKSPKDGDAIERTITHASSPHSVTLMQLRFASFAVINLRWDLHPQEGAHAGRT